MIKQSCLVPVELQGKKEEGELGEGERSEVGGCGLLSEGRGGTARVKEVLLDFELYRREGDWGEGKEKNAGMVLKIGIMDCSQRRWV